MGEAIITRSGGGSASEPIIPIIPGYHSLLVTVRDSNNQPFENISVHCKDGGTWYNYSTNENGQILFMANSGTVNITAYNFNLNTGIKWIDQKTTSVNNIPAQISLSNELSIVMDEQKSFTATTNNSSNIYNDYYNKNLMVRCHDFMNIFVGAGGGGGGGSDWRVSSKNGSAYGYGGGGGGAALVNNKKVDKNAKYSFSVGAGGSPGRVYDDSASRGSSGGTTTGFGVSAYGGGGASTAVLDASPTASGGYGSYSPLEGEVYKNYYGGGSGESSNCSNWGGGGGNFRSTIGGSPYGGRGGISEGIWDPGSDGFAGYNGGGGGAGGGNYWNSNTNGGSGGAGKFTVDFFNP